MSDLEQEVQIAPLVPQESTADLEAIQPIPGPEDDEPADFSEELRAMIARCMDGTEPTGRTLATDEPKRFTSRHVNICLLRAAGFKVREIAETAGYTKVMVTTIINHPYGRKIIHAVVMSRGARVLDIRTKLDSYSAELLDRMYEMAQNSEDLVAVGKVTFGLLDRAGYGAVQKVQQDVHVSKGVDSTANIARLADALGESTTIDAHVMPTYVPKPPPDESRTDMGSSDLAHGRSDTVAPSEGGLSDGIRLAKVGS